MIHRLPKLSKSNSFFLFGARGTGKSTLLKAHFKSEPHLYLDLLKPELEDEFLRRPEALSDRLEKLPTTTRWIILDEIQKVPRLLDLTHHWIENSRFKFAMTGSSARKLKRGAANLLAGRAFVYSLFPLTHRELGKAFDLNHALSWGSLPKIYQLESDEDRFEYLHAYSLTYMKEEIQAEQVVRKLEPFRNFLEIAAQSNGQIINFSNIARDVGADTKTVQSYFQILQDTLLGNLLEPFHRSIRKRQMQNPKFYFFDLGVRRALDRTLRQPLLPQTYAFGNSFEHFLITEMHRLNDYLRLSYRFSYLRTKDDAEIDLILERPGQPLALIEIKSKTSVDERDVASLTRFKKDLPKSEAYLLSLDPVAKKISGIHALYWQEALKELGF